MDASICALTASRLKLAPFCIGGNSIAVWASFADLLLHELETPELVDKPVVESERAPYRRWAARALERIEPEVGEDRPIDLDRAAEPTAGLIGEAILEVVDAHRAQRALGEVEDLVARFDGPLPVIRSIWL